MSIKELCLSLGSSLFLLCDVTIDECTNNDFNILCHLIRSQNLIDVYSGEGRLGNPSRRWFVKYYLCNSDCQGFKLNA